MNLSSLIENPLAWVFVAFILFAILYSVRSYISVLLSSLFYDYIVDCVLSYADTFIAGIGIVGIDIGGGVAAIIICVRYYKQMGKLTFLCAWEATNFFPFSVIPGMGFFNFFPIITIVMLYKQSQAHTVYSSVIDCYEYLKNENPDAAEQWKGSVDIIKKDYDSLNYIDLKKNGKGIAEGLHAEVGKIIITKLNNAQQSIITQLNEQATTGNVNSADLNILLGDIKRTVQDIDTDWRTADTEANQILQRASSLGCESNKSFFAQPFRKRIEGQEIEKQAKEESKPQPKTEAPMQKVA